MDSTHNADAAGGTPVTRHLPGHIAAALAGAGGPADSAGQPWEGRSLAGDDGKIHNFEDDDGTADAGYLAAVGALVDGSGDEAAVVASLATARVFIPIIAQLGAEAEGVDGLTADKQADMALVTLKAADGRTAMPAFTSADHLAAWHPDARPVAVYAARAALSAVAEGAELLVLDPGSDVTLVVRRPAVWALAQQQDWVPSYTDAALAAEMAAAAAGFPAVRNIELLPGARRRSRHRRGCRALRRRRRTGTAGGALPRGRPRCGRGAGAGVRTAGCLVPECIVWGAGRLDRNQVAARSSVADGQRGGPLGLPAADPKDFP